MVSPLVLTDLKSELSVGMNSNRISGESENEGKSFKFKGVDFMDSIEPDASPSKDVFPGTANFIT